MTSFGLIGPKRAPVDYRCELVEVGKKKTSTRRQATGRTRPTNTASRQPEETTTETTRKEKNTTRPAGKPTKTKTRKREAATNPSRRTRTRNRTPPTTSRTKPPQKNSNIPTRTEPEPNRANTTLPTKRKANRPRRRLRTENTKNHNEHLHKKQKEHSATAQYVRLQGRGPKGQRPLPSGRVARACPLGGAPCYNVSAVRVKISGVFRARSRGGPPRTAAGGGPPFAPDLPTGREHGR